ncbi:hypothetical protein H2199_001530 [Coniosporium tulheliwenetii]|uniref:Uncharacterized protein n=1 Tax=Coniosporium tulheliwenetii TaxID=3383036 RepID=A0ACC2ZJK8_9PEZI|nr:hypothetical protein H2199_001530 [Cladosporium sp. JES 115]
MASRHHQEKDSFFNHLFALDQSDDEHDEGLEESIATLKNSKSKTKTATASEQKGPPVKPARSLHVQATTTPNAKNERTTERPQVSVTPAIVRSVSAPDAPIAVISEAIARVKETPLRSFDVAKPAALIHSVTDPQSLRTSMMAASAMPRAAGKRKRVGTIQMVPEDQQMFKDLAFYFFPNNDTHPARRMRITKALQYGALWIKDWAEGITHVIADNSMNFPQLLKYLKIDTLPSGVIAVNEIYPADCIAFRTRLDPHQARYHVNGFKPPTTAPEVVPPSVPSTQSSLPLKPAKRDVVAREPQTPSKTSESSNPPSQDAIVARRRLVERNTTAVVPATNRYHDELADAINEAKALEDLPLDSDDESADSRSGSSSANDSGDEKPVKLLKQSSKAIFQSWQSNFQCMHENTGKAPTNNPNARTIEVLEQMCKYYDQMQDHWRTIAYRKAISSLRTHPTRITTADEASRLPFIGARLAAKIEEIIITDRLRRLDAALAADPADAALQLFLRIYGVGFTQASRWVGQGFRTLSDLLANNAKLSASQRIGVEHYDDFNARIPRAEVAQHGRVVRAALQRLDPAVEVIVGDHSGDIDLVITHATAGLPYLRTVVFETLVPQLTARGFLKAALATSHRNDGGGTKWHGASCLPPPSPQVWRRIDFLLVPPDELGAALIYFTGNDIFNRSIRLLASRKGMRLNQRGLWRDVGRGPGRSKTAGGTLVEGRSERRIFEVLGVPWRMPEQRIC